MTIYWGASSPVLAESIKTQAPPEFLNGGNAYDFAAAECLGQEHSLHVWEHAVKFSDQSRLKYIWGCRENSPNADLLVLEPIPALLTRKRKGTKYIAILHHIDERRLKADIKYQLYIKLLLRKLKAFDQVVVVSEYWQSRLQQYGITQTRIIYNSFDTAAYQFSDEEKKAFRSSLGFPEDQPLIYLGNSGKGKGVVEAYEQLKDKPYLFVSTGRKNENADLPVHHFNLQPHEYRKLLASCDLVLAMSTMTEGWNRVAHEAMLLRTPVIGSGSGGMSELLTKGGQCICSNWIALAGTVSYVLSNRDKLGTQAHNYVKQFDERYFCQEWSRLIRSIVNGVS